MRLSKFEEIAIASRTFLLAALLGLSFIVEGSLAVRVVLIVAVIAAMATYISLVSSLAPVWPLTAEMLLVGLVIGLTLPQSLILLPYLVVLSMLAGLAGQWRGAALVNGAQVLATILVPIASTGFTEFSEDSRLLAPWLSTSLAMGLLGGAVSSIVRPSAESNPDASYRSARRLLTQLHVVARRLPGGLDVRQIAGQVLTDLTTHTDIAEVALFSRSESGVFVPLATLAPEDGIHSRFQAFEGPLRMAWSTMEPVHERGFHADGAPSYQVALPLRVGPRVVAVALCDSPAPLSTVDLAGFRTQLDDHAIRLDTALLFEQIRVDATIDERQRLAREIHDGVAQEVASLGYLVDELAQDATSVPQAERLATLRGEISRVITELRYSIFDLRLEGKGRASLGSALSDYLSDAETRSTMRVQFSLDEGPGRLPPSVESELLRIAQEAITNARKHSRARNIWVDCWVRAPAARVCVRDDGAGLGTPSARSDSYGLSIMRERAERIGATLTVDSGNATTHGTFVTVEIGDRDRHARPRVRSEST